MPAPANASLAERITTVRTHPQYAALETLPDQLAFLRGGSKGDRLILASDTSSPAPPAAVLRIIARISQSENAIRSNGTYNPSNTYDREDVTKAKLRLLIHAPTNDDRFSECAKDYDSFVKNLRTIQNRSMSTNTNQTLFPPIDDIKGGTNVRVLHRLVVPRNKNNETIPLPYECTFEGWPVEADGQWRRELNEVKGTHDISPLPAFDVDGNLILPTDYEDKLNDAIVDLSFTLIHFNFSGSSRLCLYLTELHVLPPVPLPEIPSPLKKRGREEEGEKEAGEKGAREKEVGKKEVSEEEVDEKEVRESEVGENEVREYEAGGERDKRRQQLRKKPSRICRTLYKFRHLFITA